MGGTTAMWIISLLLVLAGFGAVHTTAKKRLQIKQSRFAQRDSMSLESIARTYYPTFNADEVTRLWVLVAQTLALDAEKLRPTDRFDSEFAPVKGYLTEDELVDLEDILSKHCQQHQIEVPKNLKTLDQFVRFMLGETDARGNQVLARKR